MLGQYNTGVKSEDQESDLLKNNNFQIVEKSFQCSFENCFKIFREKGNLKTHLRIHVK
jgi:uncharacterized Zn-finger protein